MAELNMGNLYEMNKQLVAKYEKELKGKALSNKVINTVKPYLKDFIKNEEYFMLLCNERKDYTIFHLNNNEESIIDKISEWLLLCLRNRGAVFGIDRTQDKQALEI